jgi:2-polyprenyl-3-methyl-5-hydroxy-6-metoxy-1,4-benzoquinol methylase
MVDFPLDCATLKVKRGVSVSETYAVLAPTYDRIGMADFAANMTGRLLTYAQQNEWLGRRIVDLGCGTGASMRWLARHGYSVTGVDIEQGMLREAEAAFEQDELTAQFITSDIRSLELADRADMVLALDVINELDSLRDLEAVFRKVHTVLGDGKLFIFDLHTIAGMAQAGLDGERILYDADDLLAFTRTAYDFERQICTTRYDVFNKQTDHCWERGTTVRVRRAYPVQAVATLLRRHGFDVMAVLNTRLEKFDLASSGVPRLIFLATKV